MIQINNSTKIDSSVISNPLKSLYNYTIAYEKYIILFE